MKKKDIELKNIKEGKEFQYRLLKSRKQSNYCYAFCFNKKGNILFVACTKNIIIYFNGYPSRMLQKLVNHSDDVSCLHFMKNSNSFVSGSGDNSIIIWEFDKFSKWSINTQLKEHKDWVLCILMNKNEDLLISGSKDKTVRFWRKIDYTWSCQQTINLGDCSHSLSLNEQEEKLISCGYLPFIQVMQMKLGKTWSVIQTIQVAQKGYRLQFLNDNQWIFQPQTKDFIEIYYFDNKIRQFKKHKQIQVQSCVKCNLFFPIQIIRDLKILAVKHGQFLNIFKFQDDGDINLIQTIEFNDPISQSNFTDDGKYLSTWDCKSKEIQLRQLIYLE